MNIDHIVKDDTFIKKRSNSKYISSRNNKTSRQKKRNKTVKIIDNKLINIKAINNKTKIKDDKKEINENNNLTKPKIKYIKDIKDINDEIKNLIQFNKYKKINNSLPSSFNKDKYKVKFKLLSDKEKTISNELKKLKENKNYIKNISLKNIGIPKSLIDNNINKDILRNINIKEKELTGKLYSIDSDINNLLSTKNDNNDKKIINNQLQNYLSFSKEEKKLKTNKFISKLRKLNFKYKNNIKNNNEEKNTKIDSAEEKEKEREREIHMEKKIFLSEQRQKEINIILKRKEETNKKIKNLISKKPKSINLKKNYLYIKMENEFIENEKNYIKDKSNQRKLEVRKENKKINVTKKNNSAERAEKKASELHKLWHSRSLILQKLKINTSPIGKEMSKIEEKNIEKEKKENKIKLLINNKKHFIENNIKLPPISELLQKEIKTRLKKSKSTININVQSKNKKIFNNKNKLISFGSNNLNNKEKEMESLDSNKSNRILKSKQIQYKKPESRIKTLKNLNNKVSNNNVRTGNEINYLEELKQKRLLKSIEKNTNMSKSILNLENNDLNLKNKIEAIESKYTRNKELLKLKGGYLKNKELGDNLDELLIDSIKGKLSIIENN